MPTFVGTSGPETINGTSGNDDIFARAGNDVLNGLAGNDRLFGEAGNDRLVGGTGLNDYTGGSGSDVFFMSTRGFGNSDDLITDFVLDADRVNVVNWGVSDFSQIFAMLRFDDFGDATLNAQFDGFDHVLTFDDIQPSELAAADFVFYTGGAQNRIGTANDDVLFGSAFAEGLVGDDGDDALLGGGGNDKINGGDGDDDLIGGGGRDALTGGAGIDAFVFADPSETPNSSLCDRIVDFNGNQDLIDLLDMDARPDRSGDQAFSFIGTNAFTAAGQVRYQAAGTNTLVYGSTDADADAEFLIYLIGQHTLGVDDFIL